MEPFRKIIARGSQLFVAYNISGIRVVAMDLPSSTRGFTQRCFCYLCFVFEVVVLCKFEVLHDKNM